MPGVIEDSRNKLTASYTSPSGEKQFTYTITAPSRSDDASKSTATKTAYLHELRSSTKKLQEDINVFLTAKMEEDKKVAATNGKSAQKTKDEEEEENYGEEVVEDD
jgi:hypothetical protein